MINLSQIEKNHWFNDYNYLAEIKIYEVNFNLCQIFFPSIPLVGTVACLLASTKTTCIANISCLGPNKPVNPRLFF